MSDGKIRISWDEIHSPQVDSELKRAEAIGRVQELGQRQSDLPAAVPATGHSLGSVLRNPVVLMLSFGILGGLAASGCGELAVSAIPSDIEEYQQFLVRNSEIVRLEQRRQISEEDAKRRYQRLDDDFRKNPYIALDLDPSLTEAAKRERAQQIAKADQVHEWTRWAVFYCLVAMMLAIALAIAEPTGAANVHGVAVNGAVGAVLGLVGGVVVSSFIDSLYRALGGGLDGTTFGQQLLARMLGWSVLGLFVAVAPGIVMGSFKKLAIGLAGGFLGGLLGGFLFDPIGLATGSAAAGRFVGVVSIGCLTGVGTGLIENAVKSGWLRVTHGLIAGKQFIMYRNPTVIGSSPQSEIYLFKDVRIAPRHALVHAVTGGFELEDAQSDSGTFVNGQPITRSRLRSGDVIQIGSTCFSFQERAPSRRPL